VAHPLPPQTTVDKQAMANGHRFLAMRDLRLQHYLPE